MKTHGETCRKVPEFRKYVKLKMCKCFEDSIPSLQKLLDSMPRSVSVGIQMVFVPEHSQGYIKKLFLYIITAPGIILCLNMLEYNPNNLEAACVCLKNSICS